MNKRALISVSDKTGIEELAAFLTGEGFEIISTGGTAKLLRKKGIKITEIADFTGFPEMLEGRVKTLHPLVHGGILAQREEPGQMEEVKRLDIKLIDLVVVNLYPFVKITEEQPANLENALDNIDIGGVTLLRAAAKNFKDVVILSHPEDYDYFIENGSSGIDYSWRASLAVKAYRHTAAYDSSIASFLADHQAYNENLPLFQDELTLSYKKVSTLRYGENPHQKAALYRQIYSDQHSLVNGRQLHGKELSYNNYGDMEAALALLREFDRPVAVAVKHKNPCGVASAEHIKEAYIKALNADPISIFGGIVGFNRTVDADLALELKKIFLEVIIAPAFTREALDILQKKKNIRLIEQASLLEIDNKNKFEFSKIDGGLLVQEANRDLINTESIQYITKRRPDENQLKDLIFAWKVVKHVRSNGIVIAKDLVTLGIGPGQTSRIWALENAVNHSTVSTRGAVLASDAFFPFGDSIETAHEAGIEAVIQPGGSVRDEQSIEACDKYGMAMIFTGIRHFKH